MTEINEGPGATPSQIANGRRQALQHVARVYGGVYNKGTMNQPSTVKAKDGSWELNTTVLRASNGETALQFDVQHAKSGKRVSDINPHAALKAVGVNRIIHEDDDMFEAKKTTNPHLKNEGLEHRVIERNYIPYDKPQGVASGLSGQKIGGYKEWPSTYKYKGMDKASGLHVFQDGDGKKELFGKTKSAPAGWHLKRGNWHYEFARSANENVEIEDMSDLTEKLGSNASVTDYIKDFVHSDNERFAGKSKKERIKMALGAYYGQKEAVEPVLEAEPMNESEWGKMSQEAQELVLHGDNTQHLYHTSKVPIMKNLNKKFDKGVYDHEKGKKLWGYHADRVAHSYAQEHGSKDVPWHKMFPMSVRREAAKHWADEHHQGLKDGSDDVRHS